MIDKKFSICGVWISPLNLSSFPICDVIDKRLSLVNVCYVVSETFHTENTCSRWFSSGTIYCWPVINFSFPRWSKAFQTQSTGDNEVQWLLNEGLPFTLCLSLSSLFPPFSPKLSLCLFISPSLPPPSVSFFLSLSSSFYLNWPPPDSLMMESWIPVLDARDCNNPSQWPPFDVGLCVVAEVSSIAGTRDQLAFISSEGVWGHLLNTLKYHFIIG